MMIVVIQLIGFGLFSDCSEQSFSNNYAIKIIEQCSGTEGKIRNSQGWLG